MIDNSYARDITIGALLHDIGKIVQRGDQSPTSKTHQVFGAEWLEGFEFLRKYSGYALWHHTKDATKEKAPLVMIVNQADMLAAGERTPHEKDEETKWAKDTPLLSIFSKIRIGGEAERRAVEPSFTAYYYPLRRADQVLFPQESTAAEKATRESYAELLAGLEHDLRKTEPIFGANVLMMILEKYLSFVPGDTKVERGSAEGDPDISLFDHVKLTAAIAASLYSYLVYIQPNLENWDEELIYDLGESRFLIADADISGIQGFIYNISSKGALRSLRARSFYLEMVCENISDRILKTCGLERTNVIFSGGGRVRLLLPNTDGAKATLRDVENSANAFFRQQLGGGIGLNLAWEEFAGGEMMGSSDSGLDTDRSYSDVLKTLAKKLETRKRERIREEVVEKGFEVLGPFEPALDECRICHIESDDIAALRDDVEEEEQVPACPTCKSLHELGGDLRQLKKLWMAEAADTEGFRSIRLPFGYLIWKGGGGASEQADGKGIVLTDVWDIASYSSPHDYGSSYPHYREGDDFSDLAEKSCGEHWLGVLRMDVDSLGRVFGEGIREEERSFSRISVLSRMMNAYFRETLPRVLRGLDGEYEHFSILEDTPFPRALEIVYAGGDDLFIVGAWDQLLEAAFDIRRTFGRYVCNNPDVHISGGMVIGRHDHPLQDLAKLAEGAEERAKGIDESKDRIDIFGRPAKWRKYEEGVNSVLLPLLNLSEGARGIVKSTNGARRVELQISRGFLRQIMSIALRYEGLEKTSSTGKLAFPYLAYVIARAREGFSKHFNDGSLSKAKWDLLESSLFETEFYDVVYSLASWADLLARGGEVNE